MLASGVTLASAVLGSVIWWVKHEAHSHWKAPDSGPWVSPQNGETRSDGLKGYTAQWVPFEAREHPLEPTKIWGKVRRPYPTGAWWTNLVVGGPSSQGIGLGAAMVTPYAVTVTPETGVALSYGVLTVTNESLTISTAADVAVTMLEGVNRRYVMAHDDLTMTMRLEGRRSSDFIEGGLAIIDALFARGSPYVTFSFDMATPVLHSEFEIAALRLVSPGAASLKNESRPMECSLYPSCVEANMVGDCCPMDAAHGYVVHPCCDGPLGKQGPGEIFALEVKNGQHWRIYTSSPLVFMWSAKGGVKAMSTFTGILRVALVPDDSGLTGTPALERIDEFRNKQKKVPDAVMLDAHAESYPTNGEVRVSADRSEDVTAGNIEFYWRVAYMGSTLSLDSETTAPALLMMALQHHVQSLVVDSSIGFLPLGSLDYRGGLKGPVRPILGSLWRMRHKLTPVSWRPQKVLKDQAIRADISAMLRADTMRQNGEPDSKAAWIAYNDWYGNAYWNGKEAARLATLALIAEDLQDEESLHSANAQLRAILDLWLEGANADPLVYDATYGGLCTMRGLYDHDADFGSE